MRKEGLLEREDVKLLAPSEPMSPDNWNGDTIGAHEPSQGEG
jgi:hypothetical protein